MAETIDLNADVGESDESGHDAALVGWVTSVNVACGVHAGSATLMRRIVRLARRAGVAVGAHPGFPDREGFGRRELEMPGAEVADQVRYQVSALAGIAAAQGERLRHVKPHGALYNLAARDRSLAEAVVAAVATVDRSLRIVGPPGSELLAAAARDGLPMAAEAFADRAYRPDGSLVPRREPGAVIHDPATVVGRVLRLVQDGEVVAIDGSVVRLEPDTICLHSDTPDAAELARLVRRGLADAGIRAAPCEP